MRERGKGRKIKRTKREKGRDEGEGEKSGKEYEEGNG